MNHATATSFHIMAPMENIGGSEFAQRLVETHGVLLAWTPLRGLIRHGLLEAKRGLTQVDVDEYQAMQMARGG